MLDQQWQHKDVLVQQWQSVTTQKVLIQSLVEKICISFISRPGLTALFASESSLKLYSLFFKPHPRSLDFFPACFLETESPPSLCLFSLLPANFLLLNQELFSVIVSHPELTPCHVPQYLILLQSFIQIMLFLPGIQLSFSICSYWMHNSGSYKALWCSGWVSSVVFVSHCASSWEQAGKHCNVFEEVIWNLKITLQSCLICSYLIYN